MFPNYNKMLKLKLLVFAFRFSMYNKNVTQLGPYRAELCLKKLCKSCTNFIAKNQQKAETLLSNLVVKLKGPNFIAKSNKKCINFITKLGG